MLSDFVFHILKKTCEFAGGASVVQKYGAKRHSFFFDDSSWPEGLTLEDNLIDLGWHQREFSLRYSFAYTVVTPSEDRCLGCVYINPSPKSDYDAIVTMLVRAEELESPLDGELYSSVRCWISSRWPFERTAYPGREIPLDLWFTLPD